MSFDVLDDFGGNCRRRAENVRHAFMTNGPGCIAKNLVGFFYKCRGGHGFCNRCLHGRRGGRIHVRWAKKNVLHGLVDLEHCPYGVPENACRRRTVDLLVQLVQRLHLRHHGIRDQSTILVEQWHAVDWHSLPFVDQNRHHLGQVRVRRVCGRIHFTTDQSRSDIAAAGVARNVLVINAEQIQAHGAGYHAAMFGRHAAKAQLLADNVGGRIDTTFNGVRAGVDDETRNLHTAKRRELTVLERKAGQLQKLAKRRAWPVVNGRSVLRGLQKHVQVRIERGCTRHVINDDRRVAFQIRFDVLGQQSTDGRAACRSIKSNHNSNGLAGKGVLFRLRGTACRALARIA
jgi:hypothetical protein